MSSYPTYVTLSARSYLEGLKKNLGEEEANMQAEIFLSSVATFIKALSREPAGAERAESAWLMLGCILPTEISKTIKRPITCAKECFECCRMYVATTQSEVKAIYKYVKENNIEADWDRAEKQRRLDEEGYYTDRLGEDNKCMFLSDEGTCKVYPVRPLACRLHFVVSPKKDCCMLNPQRVLKVFLPQSESVLIALLNLELATRGSLPELMLKHKELL